MGRPRTAQGEGFNYLVLNRSCADLYKEIAEVFEDRPDIKLVVGRRQGKGTDH